jgi:hypothetical protein
MINSIVTINEKIIRETVVVLNINITTNGNEIPAMIELSETYFEIRSVIRKMPIQIREAIGFIAITTPRRVATPLPPLKPAKTGKI